GFLTALIGQVRPGAGDMWSKYSNESLGIDVARHLFEVAAGLDSQMIGENQVLSQVKSAYTQSLDCRTSSMIFHRLFHNAFRVGKAVRTDTNINCGAVSVGLAAVELAKKEIKMGRAKPCTGSNPPSAGSAAMVIGAGENAELVARYLLKAGLGRLIIANRNKRRAKALARRVSGGRTSRLKANEGFDVSAQSNVIGLGDIAGRLDEVDLLISSTAAPEPVLTYKVVKSSLVHRAKPLLIIDIAVPRDIDPDIGRFKCVSLYNIDDLNEQICCNREKRSREIPKARAIVAEFTGSFAKWYDSLSFVPVISNLTRKGLKLAHSEARRYAKDFGEGNSDKLKSFAESLVKKVLHGPISFIKNGGGGQLSTEQLQAIDLINKMFLSSQPRD
ncbi:MAG: glutamyl-tRNA reductase, partial [Planctomycetota bacterium]|nr:glutamyl-tRNA reductase [Planctomycetota bacterium]